VVILLMAIGGYSINGYWWLFYEWLIMVINKKPMKGLIKHLKTTNQNHWQNH
jgi:hypothetical protein